MLKRGIMIRKRVDLYLGWRHNAGFHGQDGGRIFDHPGESIDNPTRYMSRFFRNVLDWVE